MNRLVSKQLSPSSSSGSTSSWGKKLFHAVSRLVTVGGSATASTEATQTATEVVPVASKYRYNGDAKEMDDNSFGAKATTNTTTAFDRYREPKRHNDFTNDNDDSEESNDDDNISETTKCQTDGEVTNDEDETFNRVNEQDPVNTALIEGLANGVQIPGTSAGLVKIKQEKTDDDEADHDVVDVDKNNVPVHMIRVPLQEWEEMVKAKQKLETLEAEQTGRNQPTAHVVVVTLDPKAQESGAVRSRKTQVTANAEALPSRRGRSTRPRKETLAPNEKTGTSGRGRPRKNQIAVNASAVKPRRGRPRTLTNLTPQDNPFECSTCGKRFAKRESLDMHKISHSHPLGQFSCPFCDKNDFKTAHHLRQHAARHNPTIPCEFCGKLLGSLAFIRAHQRSNKRCIQERGIQQVNA